jgi:hypothetical protein
LPFVTTGNHFFTAISGLKGREIKRMTIFSIVEMQNLSNLFALVATALKGTKGHPYGSSNSRNTKKSRIGGSVGTNTSKGEVSALTPTSGCCNSSSGSSGDGLAEKTEESSKDGGNSASVVENKEGAKTTLPAEKETATRSKVEDCRSVTLPCIDFEHFRQAENEKEGTKQKYFSGLPTGQLYMTVTLMDDADESKRCFHCAFTNTAPSKESAGPITQSLLTEMFSVKRGAENPTTISNVDNAKKRNHFSLC